MLAGRPDEAVPLLERAIVSFGKFAGKDSPDVIAATLTLAQAQFGAGHLDQASRLFDSAAATIQQNYPKDDRLANRLVTYKSNTEKIKSGYHAHCGA
jgi:ATP/maltotriose-dependent transcriptional regulator MalT